MHETLSDERQSHPSQPSSVSRGFPWLTWEYKRRCCDDLCVKCVCAHWTVWLADSLSELDDTYHSLQLMHVQMYGGPRAIQRL
ncbi:hypothetical protein KCU96_g50, partial [Aureobasidium melanogenum]